MHRVWVKILRAVHVIASFLALHPGEPPNLDGLSNLSHRIRFCADNFLYV